MKNSRLPYLIIIILLIVVIIIILLMRCGTESIHNFFYSDDENAISVSDVETKSQEEIQQELNDAVEAGMMTISMATEVNFNTCDSEGYLNIVNDETNTLPQVVTITRCDTGDELYKSGLIYPGKTVQYATLETELAAGSYECCARFEGVDPETMEVTGAACAIISINILN